MDKIQDINGNEFEIEANDFDFVQKDKKIFDKKFDTKPTTFAKDAFKRFCKNRSSVVGAIIIGILMLLAIIVPIFNTHDTGSARPEERFLGPKLFNFGGNGSSTFWTGTKHYENIVYDANNKTIGGDFVDTYAYNLKLSAEGEYYTDVPHQYAYGGSFVAAALEPLPEGSYADDYKFNVYSYKRLNFTSTDDLVIKFGLNGSYGDYGDYTLAEYKIDILYQADEESPFTVINLVPSTIEHKVREINLSQAIANAGLTEINGAIVRIECMPSSEKQSYVAIDYVELTSTNAALQDEVSKLNFSDGNAQAFATDDDDNYWGTGGLRLVHNANIIKASFDYDEYEAVFGLQKHTIVSQELEGYIKKGWCTYDPTTQKFEKLSDKCPIEKVYSQKTIGEVYELDCDVYMYRYYGYDSMPIFLFGTDQQGRDIFKYAFFALQTSLIIAIIVTAINFTIGLIYGSIEGYFGGNVDLIMERVTDILGYIPFTILITLIFLNMGKTLFVFGLGMTLTGWLGVAGRTRTQFYRFKGREYVLASRTLGASDARLIFKHVLPNALGTLITTSILMVPGTVLAESSLAYLGLGLQGTASFGVVLSDNQQYLSTHPALILFPAVIISLLMISFNLFGNGLRDALNPSLKGSD